MTIATSATVQPSARLKRLFWGFCGMIVFMLIVVLMDVGGSFSFFGKITLFSLGLGAVFLAIRQFRRQQAVWQLDISHQGVIRMRAITSHALDEYDKATVYRLMPGSVFWASLLMLRLQSGEGEQVCLPILHDSVSTECFRALSVALRWIAAKGEGVPA